MITISELFDHPSRYSSIMMDDVSTEVSTDNDYSISNAVETISDDVDQTFLAAELTNDITKMETTSEATSNYFDEVTRMIQHVQRFGVDRSFLAITNSDSRLSNSINVNLPACESFSIVGNPDSVESIAAIEGLGDIVNKIWNFITGIFKKIIDFIKRLFGFGKESSSSLEKQNDDLEKKVNNSIDVADATPEQIKREEQRNKQTNTGSDNSSSNNSSTIITSTSSGSTSSESTTTTSTSPGEIADPRTLTQAAKIPKQQRIIKRLDAAALNNCAGKMFEYAKSICGSFKMEVSYFEDKLGKLEKSIISYNVLTATVDDVDTISGISDEHLRHIDDLNSKNSQHIIDKDIEMHMQRMKDALVLKPLPLGDTQTELKNSLKISRFLVARYYDVVAEMNKLSPRIDNLLATSKRLQEASRKHYLNSRSYRNTTKEMRMALNVQNANITRFAHELSAAFPRYLKCMTKLSESLRNAASKVQKDIKRILKKYTVQK